MNFATFLQDKRAEPLLASLAFVLVFLAGFGLFSFTGSIEIAAAVIAVGGLAATLAINLINQARHKSNSSAEPHETRMRSLESALQMAELRIAANESTIQSIVKTDIAPLKAKMAELDRLADFDMSDKSPSRRGPRSEASPSEPVHSQTFHSDISQPEPPQWTHPLRARREEARLRALLGEGRLVLEKFDITSKVSNRIVYRHLDARCDGFGPGDQSEAALRAAHMSSDILRLFDRVRFAHVYNRALDDARIIDTPILITPLSVETLLSPDDVKTITALLKRTTKLAKKIGVIVPVSWLTEPSHAHSITLTDLRDAGLLIGVTLDRHLLSNPGDLMREPPDFILAAARLLAEAENGTLVCAIHPADLLAMFDRRGTDLIATNIATRRDREAVLALGIHLMSYSNKAALALEPARSSPPPSSPEAPPPPPFKLGVPSDDEGDGPIPLITQPSSLRERLRRLSA